MTRKILSAIIVMAVAAVATWNVNKNNSRDVAMSDLAMENVEALSAETGDGKICRMDIFYSTYCFPNVVGPYCGCCFC